MGALSMNRTNSEYALPSKAAEDRRTPRRYRVGDSRAHFRQVLECAGPAALWIAQTGSWSQCMRRSERGLSMNRTNSDTRSHRKRRRTAALQDATALATV